MCGIIELRIQILKMQAQANVTAVACHPCSKRGVGLESNQYCSCILSGQTLVCTLQAFNLVDSKELVPLQELIDQMVN